ncbi:MAG: 5-formyltetrahydrofolate cyclo-ligase [Clostridium sp.]|nr:5-formyltetrahydrofolate cyclo-ligase [Clostridium sp.]
MDKKSLRREMIQKRDSVELSRKNLMDLVIKKKLMNLQKFKEAKNIFIYIGYGSEIDTYKYIKEFLNMGKNIYVPKTNVREKTMEAVQINSLDNLVKGTYGILEPDSFKNKIDKDKIDLVILPGVVFDKQGGRIGYGGGYYDKYLMNMDKNIFKVALCYEFQIIDEVPTEPHDIKADLVLTEK